MNQLNNSGFAQLVQQKSFVNLVVSREFTHFAQQGNLQIFYQKEGYNKTN